MEPIKGVDGKRWAKMFVYFCLSWAHSSAAERPMPKSTQEVRGNSPHAQADQGRNVWQCAGNGVCCKMFTFCFPKISSHSLHQFWLLRAPSEKNHALQWWAQVGKRRLQSYALRTLFGYLYLWKGWPSGGGRPYIVKFVAMNHRISKLAWRHIQFYLQNIINPRIQLTINHLRHWLRDPNSVDTCFILR